VRAVRLFTKNDLPTLIKSDDMKPILADVDAEITIRIHGSLQWLGQVSPPAKVKEAGGPYH
jgi:hypothetical protein